MNTEWFGLAQCVILALTGIGGVIWIMAVVMHDHDLDALWVLGALLGVVPALFCCLWAYESVLGFIAGMTFYLAYGSWFQLNVWKHQRRPSKTDDYYRLFKRYR